MKIQEVSLQVLVLHSTKKVILQKLCLNDVMMLFTWLKIVEEIELRCHKSPYQQA